MQWTCRVNPWMLHITIVVNCKCMQLMALDVPGMLIHTISHAIDQSCCPCGPAVPLMWATQVSDFRTLFTVTLPLILHPMEFLHCMALSSTWKYGSSSTWPGHGYHELSIAIHRDGLRKAYWRQSWAFFLPLSLSFLNLTTVKLISHFWFVVCLGGLHRILQVGSEVWSILVCPLWFFRWTNPTAEMSNSVLGSVWICCAFTILLSKFHCDMYQNDTGVTQLVDLVVVGFLQLLATVATPQGIRQHLATKKLLREVWLRGHRCVGQNEQLVRVTSWPGSRPGSCQYRHPISSLLVLKGRAFSNLFYAVPSHSQGPWQLIWSKSLVLGISCFHAWPAILRTSHWVTSDAQLTRNQQWLDAQRSHLCRKMIMIYEYLWLVSYRFL